MAVDKTRIEIETSSVRWSTWQSMQERLELPLPSSTSTLIGCPEFLKAKLKAEFNVQWFRCVGTSEAPLPMAENNEDQDCEAQQLQASKIPFESIPLRVRTFQ